jgi:choline dehydrogenase-like flavoprotein
MTLNPGELRTLAAICDALLPADDPAWRTAVPRRATASLRALSLRDSRRVRLCLHLLETPPAGLLLARRWGTFSDLDQAQRARALRTLAASRLSLARAVFESFKRLVTAIYYADSDANGTNPTWGRLRYPGPIARSQQVGSGIAPLAIDSDTVLECDAVIVGSGAGGSVVAGELAANGWDVVILEQGPYVADAEFDQREIPTLQRAYLEGGLASTSDRAIAILAGSCLGGGTVVNFTTSFRTPASVRREWTSLTGLSLFSGDEFTHSLDAVCDRLGVNTLHNRASRRDALMARGLSAHGWHVEAMPRNVEGCTQDDVCGYCGLGCVRGAKRSMVKTYLQDAHHHGARIVVRCSADRLVVRDGRGVGVAARTRDGHDLLVRARVVVVAAGAIHSPALLLRSGVRGAVGRMLRLHPATAVWGRFDDPVRPWTGTLQALYSDQFADLDNGYGARLETAPIHPAYLALSTPWDTPQQFDARMQQLAHTSLIGVLLRDRSAGRVRLDRHGAPRVEYHLSRYDQRHVRTAVVGAARVLHAAGAREIWTTQSRRVCWTPRRERLEAWLSRVDAIGYGAHETVYGSWHQMGTCRMGRPWDSVVDGSGELHALENVFVADASLFPTASGVNPMITIAALAHYVSRRIHARLDQGARR